MSKCSCGDSCSGNCSAGPCIKINDLPKGEQVVTTIKREDIPKPPKKETTPLWVYILMVYLALIFLWALKDSFHSPYPYPPDSHLPPPKPYPPPCIPHQDPFCP
ncbi:hypothetical protein HJG54_08665 [Leptolyngbya sp. NK1-12]|uniref:Uncharacterized protein n=1 Tax=Leptolyngbya sp. NK1-12 TaxID=2547451 RepID=A0AA97AQ61_9CYAN|nr:hypothetical protein [Leptolyngbya sp. NK1-12]WNZ22923.1 hypothetical protein HJG54_08665 [Leptolyngbya sp. NK1-12]